MQNFEKKSPLLYDFYAFLKNFFATFNEVNCNKIVHTKFLNLQHRSCLKSTSSTMKFRQLICDVKVITDYNDPQVQMFLGLVL
jgi:hypothetical protein